MALEIERKFLVNGEAWRVGEPGVRCIQSYLDLPDNARLRVRILGEQGFLTLKTRKVGLTRDEFEYLIPVADAMEMMAKIMPECGIEKTRYTRSYGAKTWTIDEFIGKNRGLVLAEIELEREDETFSLPPWVGREVSDDLRYLNSSLTNRPFTGW